jgi:hypothetical protein
MERPCSAHAALGEFVAGAWINRRPAPRFHPNLVTLGRPQDEGAHRDALRALRTAPPARNWAVKDSFAALDLGQLGFDLLFDACWVHRPGGAFDRAAPDCRVLRVTSAAALAAWEHAWRGGSAEPRERLFRPALLTGSDHAVIALVRDGAIVAGCIASRSDGVLGIGNLFAPAEDDGALRAACLAAATRVAPGSPLVGYEHGESLARMTELGFGTIGPLRVWQASR